MNKEFYFDLNNQLRRCTAELIYKPEVFLKVNITVFNGNKVDFKATVYTNPSFPEYSKLVLKEASTLVDDGIGQFKSKFNSKYLEDVRKSGINVIYNWTCNT